MLILLAVFGCSTASNPSVRTVDVAALNAAQPVPVLLDVRSPEEFAAGHVPGAKNLPIQQLGDRMAEVEPYRGGEVWLICESGGRSARAAGTLAEEGFSAVDVAGGTAAWRAAGYPTE